MDMAFIRMRHQSKWNILKAQCSLQQFHLNKCACALNRYLNFFGVFYLIIPSRKDLNRGHY